MPYSTLCGLCQITESEEEGSFLLTKTKLIVLSPPELSFHYSVPLFPIHSDTLNENQNQNQTPGVYAVSLLNYSVLSLKIMDSSG